MNNLLNLPTDLINKILFFLIEKKFKNLINLLNSNLTLKRKYDLVLREIFSYIYYYNFLNEFYKILNYSSHIYINCDYSLMFRIINLNLINNTNLNVEKYINEKLSNYNHFLISKNFYLDNYYSYYFNYNDNLLYISNKMYLNYKNIKNQINNYYKILIDHKNTYKIDNLFSTRLKINIFKLNKELLIYSIKSYNYLYIYYINILNRSNNINNLIKKLNKRYLGYIYAKKHFEYALYNFLLNLKIYTFQSLFQLKNIYFQINNIY